MLHALQKKMNIWVAEQKLMGSYDVAKKEQYFVYLV